MSPSGRQARGSKGSKRLAAAPGIPEALRRCLRMDVRPLCGCGAELRTTPARIRNAKGRCGSTRCKAGGGRSSAAEELGRPRATSCAQRHLVEPEQSTRATKGRAGLLPGPAPHLPAPHLPATHLGGLGPPGTPNTLLSHPQLLIVT